jgi:hypothetical protein
MTADHPRQPARTRPSADRRRAGGALLLLTLLVSVTGLSLSGCGPQRRNWSPAQSSDGLDDAAFIHALAETPTASVDEGLRAVLMVVASGQVFPTVEARWQAALDRGLVKTAWKLHPEDVLTRGVLAYMLQRGCGLTPDLASALASRTGWGDRRYAVRICADDRLLAYGSPDGRIRGGELLDAVARAEAFLDRRRMTSLPEP